MAALSTRIFGFSKVGEPRIYPLIDIVMDFWRLLRRDGKARNAAALSELLAHRKSIN